MQVDETLLIVRQMSLQALQLFLLHCLLLAASSAMLVFNAKIRSVFPRRSEMLGSVLYSKFSSFKSHQIGTEFKPVLCGAEAQTIKSAAVAFIIRLVD